MRRRAFLQKGGVLLAGSVGGGVTGSAAGELQTRPHAANSSSHRVIMLAGRTALRAAVEKGLSERYSVRSADFLAADFKAGDEMPELGNAAALVLLAEPPADVSRRENLDFHTRRTYELLHAAVGQGVQIVVQLSSLRIVAGYDERYEVDEDWRPVPTTDPEQLSYYLGEFTCREFAREAKLRVVVLRTGDIATSKAAEGRAADFPVVAREEVVQAIRLSLDTHFDRPGGLPYWSVFHIGPDLPGSRFPINKAKRLLNYRPDLRH